MGKWQTYPSKRNMLTISEQLGFSIETLLIESQEKNSRGLRIGNYLLDYFFLLMAIVFIIITITSHNIVFLSSVVICLIFGLKKIN